MGAIECCLGGGATDYEVETPDPDVRRQKMLAAAERRKKQEDSRGLKNPERFHEQQKRKAEADKMSAKSGGDAGLKWQVG